MSEKKMLFLQCIGHGIFRTTTSYAVRALETVETSCHTLERTCMERYCDFIRVKPKVEVIDLETGL